MSLEPHDQLTVLAEARSGRLLELLAKLPRACWMVRFPDGRTLLHHACEGDNVAAVEALLVHGLDANARDDDDGSLPSHYACVSGAPRALALLCAAGALVRVANAYGNTPLDYAILRGFEDCARVLVANGVRLSSALRHHRRYITPELEAFERGVLRCRAAVVAMLLVKRAGRLAQWDKFLLVHLAVCVWATRIAPEWNPGPPRKSRVI